VLALEPIDALSSESVRTMRDSEKLRDRLAHPKGSECLIVTDDEFLAAHKAATDFDAAWVGINVAIKQKHERIQEATRRDAAGCAKIPT